MRKWFWMFGLLAGLALFLTACSNQSPESQSSSKPVNIRVESDPDPLTVGDVALVLFLTDEQGNPLEGAKVDVKVDHTDMSGMGMSGSATDQGKGKYAIKANFSMSGNWKMIVLIQKEGVEYKEEINLRIQ